MFDRDSLQHCLRSQLASVIPFNAMHEKAILKFSQAVADRPVATSTTFHQGNVEVTETQYGSRILRGVRIFKMGTFRDSRGVERTWTSEQLDLMVQHFHLLKAENIFPNVPIRADHSQSVKDLVGFFVDVYRDKTDSAFLAADIEITEPEAYDKWQRGTYRSRSLEVAPYTTNAEVTYYPVIMGMAFVDVPAVEGLHSKEFLRFSSTLNEGDEMDPAIWAAAATYAQALADWERAANYAQALADWERAATYAQALADEEARQAAQHRGGQPAHTFRVNGGTTQDFQAVQSHIDTLETFRTETIVGGRRQYVSSLVTQNKITAPMEQSMQALVATMTDEQFAAWRAAYDAAPTASLFGNYGNGEQGEGSSAGDPTPPNEVDNLREIVMQHKRSGKDSEFIKNTASYKRLVAHNPAEAEKLGL